MNSILRVENVTGGYEDRDVIRDVSFEVKKGEIFGILGPNGSGKSTLLKMISGVLPIKKGNIYFDGKALHLYRTKELAQKMAVLSQVHAQTFSYSVKETVSVGRYPYQKGFFSSWSEQDEQAVVHSMIQTGVHHFSTKSVQTLSGGELQRVYLSQALAQEPKLLLLDEPTNHLDLSYQKELLDFIKIKAHEQGLTVISIFHDLNLASLYCDRLMLIQNGKIHALAIPSEVIREETIKSVYQVSIKTHPHPEIPRPQMIILPSQSEKEKQSRPFIKKEMLQVDREAIVLQSAYPLKTMSSAVVGAGFGWFTTFVNRHVSKDYDYRDSKSEMEKYLLSKGYTPSETVAMMTAANLTDGVFEEIEMEDFSVVIAVTAGVGNAVDISNCEEHDFVLECGTINIWVFVNGTLPDEAFIQGIMTATEAKVKALQTMNVLDPVTKTIATGTSTDSMLIAATQQGTCLPYAGPITPLGKAIGMGVYRCVVKAVERYIKRTGER
jgi:iron complex transport system ATP-binding protein